MILGIVAILMTCCITYFGVALGIGGLVCSILSRKQGKTGMAMAGIICSVIAIVLGVALIIISIVFLTGLGFSDSSELLNSITNYSY